MTLSWNRYLIMPGVKVKIQGGPNNLEKRQKVVIRFTDQLHYSGSRMEDVCLNSHQALGKAPGVSLLEVSKKRQKSQVMDSVQRVRACEK